MHSFTSRFQDGPDSLSIKEIPKWREALVNDSARSRIEDITPLGDELDESALHGISGGAPRLIAMTQVDPPGYCAMD
ncbi:hypothetical protein Pve01_55500 [Planomonospora venezuelensis]|nr:hypothetical protein Pve01_55500 [Planomonospora venezuelensis]